VASGLDPKRLARMERAYGKWVASQGDQAKVEDLTRYADDPEGFIRDILGEKLLWSKQIEIIQSVREHRRTTVRGSAGAGKGHVAAALALWWMFAKRGFVVITGSQGDQVFDNFFSYELSQMWLPNKDRLGGELFRRALVPTGMNVNNIGKERIGIKGVVSKNISHLTGSHGALIFCIIDEAQGVDDFVYDALRNNALGPNDRFLAIGNPLPPEVGKDAFYKSFLEKSPWNKIVMPMSEHPNIIERRTVIPGGPSIVSMDEARRDPGESSSWWRTYVLAEFPTATADALFADRHLQRCIGNFQSQTFREQNSAGRLVVSFDVSAGGGDSCGVAVKRGRVVEQAYRFETSDITDTEDKCAAILRELGIKRHADLPWDPSYGEVDADIIIDYAATGGGPSVCAHLEKDYGYNVIHFLGARTLGLPLGDEGQQLYENYRAMGYWTLHAAVQEGTCALPPNEQLMEELRATTYTTNKQDGVLISKKKDIQKVLKRSPDIADAVMMAWTVDQEQATIGGSNPNLSLGF